MLRVWVCLFAVMSAVTLSAQSENRFVDTFDDVLTAESAGIEYLQRTSRGDAAPANAVGKIEDGALRISGIKGETGRVHAKGMGSDSISVTLRAEFVNRGEEDTSLRPRHTLGLMLRSRPESNFGHGEPDDADSGYVAVEFLNNGGLLVRERLTSGKLVFKSSTNANPLTGESLYEYAPGKLGEELNGQPFDVNDNGILGEGEPFEINVELTGHHILVRINGKAVHTKSLELAAGKGGNEVSIFKGRPGKFEVASDLVIHEIKITPLESTDRVSGDEAVEEPKSGMYLHVDKVAKIWDAAPHQAFTDLIRYDDQWVCAFREADAHEGGIPGARLRVLSSTDGKTWIDAGTLDDPRGDIRDAKLSITPDGQLMLLTAIQVFRESDDEPRRHQSIAFFTDDLAEWSGPIDVGDENYWLWGLTWHEGVGYSIGYQADTWKAHLYTTTDGKTFARSVKDIQSHTGEPNESSIVFRDDRAFVLLRTMKEAYLGTAVKPYTQWTWTKLDEKIGGPELIDLAGSHLLLGGRRYLETGQQVTSLMWVDPESPSLSEAVRLVSGGDTSYPGMVEHDDKLYVSYYSSHEGVTSIYFAEVKLVPANELAEPVSAHGEAKPAEANGPAVSEREYFLYEPTALPPGREPALLVYLYGSGGSAENFNLKREPYDQVRSELQKSGYYILVPELGRYHYMNSQATAEMDRIVERVRARYELPPGKIDLMGTSMGAGSALAYASMYPEKVRAVCAVMPMTDLSVWAGQKPKYGEKLASAFDGGPHERPLEYAKRSAMQNLDALADVPVLLLHGTSDTIVPPHHSQDLHRERLQRGDPSKLILVQGGGHRDDIVTNHQSEVAAFFTDAGWPR